MVTRLVYTLVPRLPYIPDTDKQKAESMRKIAMEKLEETHKRAVEEGEQENHMKKKRRSGNETISFLHKKAESERALREEELAI